MNKLFFNRIEDLISIIDSNAPKIILNTRSKSDLEHTYMFAYALPRRNRAGPSALSFSTITIMSFLPTTITIFGLAEAPI
jgi:hypothetical protein